MSRYIDAEKFYAEAVRREKGAYQHLIMLNPENGKNEWIKWNAILNERTAFKHDIMDFEKADVEEVRHGKWIPEHLGDCICSICGGKYSVCGGLCEDYNYCPGCGAHMDKEKEECFTVTE